MIGQRCKTVFIKEGDDRLAQLKTSLHIIDGNETRAITKLPDDVIEIMAERLGKVISEYYTQHPQEFLNIGCKKEQEEKSESNRV